MTDKIPDKVLDKILDKMPDKIPDRIPEKTPDKGRLGDKVEERLWVGAGAEEIRFPKELFPLEGFCKIHDNPKVRVLALEQKQKAVLIVLELVMLPPELIDQIKSMAGECLGVGVEQVWVQVTHAIATPHAPQEPRGMGGVRIEITKEEAAQIAEKKVLYQEAVLTATQTALRKAKESFCPGRMGMGTTLCEINVNRDVETAKGWWIGFCPEGLSNHQVQLLRFDDLEGKQIAALINYGIKPCALDNSQMKEGRRQVSSDVPGLACALLEERLGGVCIFTMSAAADQVPLKQALYDEVAEDGTIRTVDLGVEAGLKLVEELGSRMAQELAPALEDISSSEVSGELRIGSDVMAWRGKALCPQRITKNLEYVPAGESEVNVQAIALGEVALAGLRPEINTVTELQLKEKSPYAHTLVLSMVDGGQKYMPDRESYRKLTWEAQSSPLMPGAAEKWVDTAAELLQTIKASHF